MEYIKNNIVYDIEPDYDYIYKKRVRNYSEYVYKVIDGVVDNFECDPLIDLYEKRVNGEALDYNERVILSCFHIERVNKKNNGLNK